MFIDLSFPLPLSLFISLLTCMGLLYKEIEVSYIMIQHSHNICDYNIIIYDTMKNKVIFFPGLSDNEKALPG
ncbi:MAG TPA: hypothetical protein DCZ45_01840 [Parabacteroides goldsteinii]|nr:hypothetical protein [Parabacteroides goldsteinii]